MSTGNVTAAKPRTAGVIFRAPLGTPLPTDATSNLASAYKALGHIGEDGFTNSNTATSEDIRDMGGSVVMTVQTEKEDKFSCKLIDALDIEVQKAIYGEDNVDGTINTGLTISVNADEPEEAVWVLDTVMRNGVLQRIVIPDGKISELGEIAYKRDEAVGYDVTITALPDNAGNSHYIYMGVTSGQSGQSGTSGTSGTSGH